MFVSYKEIRHCCLKPDEAVKPLYARYVTHTFSTLLVWLLQPISLAPNWISLASLLTAFSSLFFFAKLTALSALTGAILVELYYILDAVDGQWARFKKMKSLSGAFFDYLINYALQPPLFFAIGWGLYRQTASAFYLLLGFIAAFSSLWVLLIWDIRASILLAHLRNKGFSNQTGEPASFLTARKPKLSREIFTVLHKSLVFPWLMNVLTIVSFLSFFLAHFIETPLAHLLGFRIFLYYYSLAGPCVALSITVYWIWKRKIDHAPELNTA
ncbi:MAG: CDP-alcohol phosphatidyltransferase family protein [Deltaproteobacteria bacterium]|nr:CDP-alcohol phosphatidyltransferase family protein [Deltaproteobacteria bacterium]